MKNENLNKQETANSDLGAVRRSILGALNGAKKNCLALKNTPHIDSREYALAHGKLEGINKAIDIVKKYCTQL
jgi:hypothetical protein